MSPPPSRPYVDPEKPHVVGSGFDSNGHVFEKNLACRCGKTLSQHNKNPWACPLALKDLRQKLLSVRKRVNSLMAEMVAMMPPAMRKGFQDGPKPKVKPKPAGGGKRKPWTKRPKPGLPPAEPAFDEDSEDSSD